MQVKDLLLSVNKKAKWLNALSLLVWLQKNQTYPHNVTYSMETKQDKIVAVKTTMAFCISLLYDANIWRLHTSDSDV